MNAGIELKDILEYIRKNDFETYLEYDNLKNELEKDFILFNDKKRIAKQEYAITLNKLNDLDKEISYINIKIQNIETEIIRDCSSMEEYQNKQLERKELVDKVNAMIELHETIKNIELTQCYTDANNYYNNVIKPKKQRIDEIERTFSDAVKLKNYPKRINVFRNC